MADPVATSAASSQAVQDGAFLLLGSELVSLVRKGRYLIAELLRPHRVLSTSMHGGGLREDCRFVVNHQSCEPVGDDEAMALFRRHGPEGYHRLACQTVDLPPEKTVLCGTAANMQCAALVQRSHAELVVAAITTAGVEGNATRAGDPAGWHETRSGCDRVAPHVGTIVNLLFINQPCSPGCLVKVASMLTEAKSTAVLDLRVPSRQSNRLATGTGTDQFTIACPITVDGEWERNHAGSHNTLGQILCEAVQQSTTEALRKQNGLTASLRCSVFAALGRHGVTRSILERVANRGLGEGRCHFMMGNLESLDHDPPTAATAFAIAETLDVAANKFFSSDVLDEALLNQSALMASVVALTPSRYSEYRARLATLSDRTPANIIVHAMVWGFAEKWVMRETNFAASPSSACDNSEPESSTETASA